jgi:hypothetical protein
MEDLLEENLKAKPHTKRMSYPPRKRCRCTQAQALWKRQFAEEEEPHLMPLGVMAGKEQRLILI